VPAAQVVVLLTAVVHKGFQVLLIETDQLKHMHLAATVAAHYAFIKTSTVPDFANQHVDEIMQVPAM
jgi:hypothetical protein